MYQAKSGIKNFSLYWRGGPPPPEKVAQNELKHILVLEFLRSNDFREGGGGSLSEIQTDTRHNDQISRSARRDGATKKTLRADTFRVMYIKYEKKIDP